MENLIVYKNNKLITAAYSLSLSEQRFILMCIGKHNPSAIKTIKTIKESRGIKKVSVEEYAKRYGISTKHAHDELKKVAEQLFSREVTVDAKKIDKELRTILGLSENTKAKIKTRWIESIISDHETDYLTVIFARAIIPYLSDLNNEFTKYNLQHVQGFSSIYAIRLYELLAKQQFTTKKELKVDINELKLMFDIASKYSAYADFKRKVIEISVKQINLLSNLNVTYTEHKKARKVVSLNFKFEFKAGQETTRALRGSKIKYKTRNKKEEYSKTVGAKKHEYSEEISALKERLKSEKGELSSNMFNSHVSRKEKIINPL